MKHSFILIGLLFVLVSPAIAQRSRERNRSKEREALHEFIEEKNSNFLKRYNSAIRYFEKNNILKDTLLNVSNPKRLIRFQDNYPLYYHSHNLSEGIFIGINTFYDSTLWHDEILGQHQLIGIWDGGHVLADHVEFVDDGISRVHIEETNHFANHASHVGGTIIAKGDNPEAKGMAPEAELYSANYLNDIAEVAIAADEQNIFLSNHSYGPVSGWSYNSDEDIWYWYGAYDSKEDYKFGFYGEISEGIDELCYLFPYYSMVVSAGNDWKEGPESQPVTHKVWDSKWKNSNIVRELDGGSDGYDCIGMNGTAKNVITVGSVNVTDDGVLETSFSSCGPTDDGRIKPDIVAPGISVLSSLADSVNAYGYYSGTSMSAAFITGGVAQLNELQYQFQPGVNLLASSLKGLLIHTAKNMNGKIGPCFKTGWGMVDFDSAHELLEDNILSGGEIITESSLDKSELFTKTISIKEVTDVKATLVWTDFPGETGEAEINNSASKLVNDLDLYLMKGEEIFYPFVLDPDSPGEPAYADVNTLDNVEQVFIENCVPGEYTICVNASILESDSQTFSLIVSGPDYEEAILPPTNLNGFYSKEGITLSWNPPQKATVDGYEIYCNTDSIGFSTDTFITDNSYVLYDDLNYCVKAVVLGDKKIESCFSNALEIRALPLYQIPYVEDFEIENLDWEYLDTDMGWRYGNTTDLSSTFISFEGNDSWFMGINSDNQGRDVHVWDYLISPPLCLTNPELLNLKFEYYLNNESFDTCDSLFIYYRTLMNQDWIFLKKMETVDSWTLFSEDFQLIENDGVVQLAFLFDDNSEWGNGTGIDNLSLDEPVLTSQNSFGLEFKCYLSDGIMYYSGLDVESGFARWSLFNVGGKKLAEGNIYISSGSTSVEIPHLSSGAYFVLLQTSKGPYVKKIIMTD